MYRELIWEINCEKSVFLCRSVNNAQTLTLTKKESRHMTTARLLSVSAHLCLLSPWILKKLTLVSRKKLIWDVNRRTIEIP